MKKFFLYISPRLTSALRKLINADYNSQCELINTRIAARVLIESSI